MQDKIRINGLDIYQPDEGLQYSFETTYTSDSTRLQSGSANFVPMFTVEQFGYTATDIPMAEATKILQMIDKGQAFTLHYYSLHYGRWRDGKFRVGKGSLSIGSLKVDKEKVSSLTFNMTGDEPI